MTEKKPSEMTPTERQDWAMRNMPLSDDPAQAKPTARPAATQQAPATPARGHFPNRDLTKPESPYSYIIYGYLVIIVAGGGIGLITGTTDESTASFVIFVLLVVAIAGGIATFVGTIGAGVRLGMRHARWEETHDR